MNYILQVLPMVSIRPDRVSLTSYVYKSVRNSLGLLEVLERKRPVYSSEKKQVSQCEKPKLAKKFHEFEISKNSQRNLRDKIGYLFQFAKSRRIKTTSGKTLPNFKVCFLTLTLPSKQNHPTSELNAQALDAFLQQMRKLLGMRNYVWRMEFQANGNVHYHICTDTYIDYYLARREWNRCLDALGYITAYANKMEKLTYSEYAAKYGSSGNVSKEILYKRYLDGKKNAWRQPNTVDVKNAKSSDNIGYYISKYFSKKEKGAKCNSLDNESNSFGLRLCFWSRSLSACKSESMPFDYYPCDIAQVLRSTGVVVEKFFDYCKVIYFDFIKLPDYAKKLIGWYFNKMREEINYMPAT